MTVAGRDRRDRALESARGSTVDWAVGPVGLGDRRSPSVGGGSASGSEDAQADRRATARTVASQLEAASAMMSNGTKVSRTDPPLLRPSAAEVGPNASPLLKPVKKGRAVLKSPGWASSEHVIASEFGSIGDWVGTRFGLQMHWRRRRGGHALRRVRRRRPRCRAPGRPRRPRLPRAAPSPDAGDDGTARSGAGAAREARPDAADTRAHRDVDRAVLVVARSAVAPVSGARRWRSA